MSQDVPSDTSHRLNRLRQDLDDEHDTLASAQAKPVVSPVICRLRPMNLSRHFRAYSLRGDGPSVSLLTRFWGLIMRGSAPLSFRPIRMPAFPQCPTFS